jgi:hypothetical protein
MRPRPATGFRKTAWCVKCNQAQPYKIVRVGGKALSFKERRCLICGEQVESAAPKYGNQPTRSKHTGRLFQSKKECDREPTLIALQNVGAISDLRYQVPFRLELYATGAVDELLALIDGDLGANGYDAFCARLVTLAEVVRRSRRRVCNYVADFTYQQDGAVVVEDPKGARTPTYRIKRELMVLAHNVEIVEPGEGGVQQRARGAGVAGRGTGSRLMGGR